MAGDADERLKEVQEYVNAEALAGENAKRGLGKSTRKDVKWFDTIVRKLIERITVYDEKYVVEFKSEIDIDVRL